MFHTWVTNIILWVGLTLMVEDQSWFCLIANYIMLIAVKYTILSLFSSVVCCCCCCCFLGMECCVSYMFPTMPNGLHEPAESCILGLKIKIWFVSFLLELLKDQMDKGCKRWFRIGNQVSLQFFALILLRTDWFLCHKCSSIFTLPNKLRTLAWKTEPTVKWYLKLFPFFSV